MGTSLGSIFIDLKINLKALDEANKKIKNFSKNITVNTKQATKSVKNMEKSWKKSMRRMSNEAFRLGTILTLSLTKGVKDVFKSVIGGAAFDELEFVKLRKLLPVTDERAAEIRSKLRQTVARVPLAAHEISNVAAEAARLGVAQEYINDFTEVMGKMSFATVLGSTDAAVALARFSNVVALPLDQIERVGSAIVHLGNNFAANEREIAKMSLRLGALKAMAGATIPEILGLSAAFPAVGLFPELVGTSMGRIATKLQNAIKQYPEMKELMAALTQKSPEQFERDFFSEGVSGKGQIQGIIDIAEGLKKASNSGLQFAEMLRAIGLDGYRISIVMSFMAENTLLFRDAIEKANEAFYNAIYLQREFDRFMNTLTNQFLLFTNQLNIIKLRLGELFLPILREWTDQLINNLIPTLQVVADYLEYSGNKTRIFVLALAGLLFSLGPIIVGFAVLLKVLLLMFGVMGVVIAIVAAFAVAGVAAGIIWKDEVSEWIDSLGMIGVAIKTLGKTLWYIVSNVVTGLVGLVATLVKAFGAAPKYIKKQWEKLKNFFKTLIDNITRDLKKLSDGIEWVLSPINKLFADKDGKGLQRQFIDAGENTADNIAKQNKKAAEAVGRYWAGAVKKTKQAGDVINNTLEPVNKLLADKDGKGLQRQFIDAGKSISEGIRKKEEASRKKFIDGIISTATDNTKKELKKLKEADENILKLYKRSEKGYSAWQARIDQRQAMLDDIRNQSKRLSPFDPKAGRGTKGELEAQYLEKVKELTDAFSAKEAGHSAAKTFSESFLSTLQSDLAGTLEKIFKGELMSLKEIFISLLNAFTQTWSRFIAEDMVDGVRRGMESSGISGFLDGLFSKVGKEAGKSFSLGFANVLWKSGGLFSGNNNNWGLGSVGFFGGGGIGGVGSTGFFGSDELASGGVLVGERGPEFVMNAKATKQHGKHLAALNAGYGGAMYGSKISKIEQNINLEPGVTADQLASEIDRFSNIMYRKLLEEFKTPDSEFRRVARHSG